MKLIITLLLIFSFNTSYAGFETFELVDYQSITDLVNKKTKEFKPGELLVVFDIDHTILMTDDCLDKDDPLEGFKRFEKRVRKCGGYLTSERVLDVISKLQNDNYEVMALTARSGGILKPTLVQLQERLRLRKRKNSPKDKLHFFTAPVYNQETITVNFDQPGKTKTLHKKLVMSEGVAFVQGADKGLALQAFNKEFNLNYKHIIFLDDSLRNIENLECAYNKTKTNMSIVHYLEFARPKQSKNPCGLR